MDQLSNQHPAQENTFCVLSDRAVGQSKWGWGRAGGDHLSSVQ